MDDKQQGYSITGCIGGVMVLLVTCFLMVRGVDSHTSITGKIAKELSGVVINVFLTGVFYILCLFLFFKRW